MENALRKQIPLLDQDTLLEQKRLELKEVQTQLDEKRQQFQLLEEKWKDREDILMKKKEHFLSRIGDMQIFTRKTSRKIEKYQQKAEEEKKSNAQKTEIIEELNKQILELEDVKESKKIHLERIESYQEFLNHVLNVEPSFQEIHKILQRYDTLEKANIELDKESKSNKSSQKNLQNGLKQMGKDGQDLLFHLNAQLSKRQQILEGERSTLQERENALVHQQNVATKTSQSLGQIKMSINNLYDRCVYSRKNKVGVANKQADTIKKLEYICNRIEDISSIYQKINERMGDDVSSK